MAWGSALEKIGNRAFSIAVKRGQTGNGFKHLAGEVIEAQEEFLKMEFRKTNENIKEFELELADILICTCSIACQYGIDLDKAVSQKMAINEDRAKNGR